MKKNLTLLALTLTTFLAISHIASAQATAAGAQQGFSTLGSLITAFNDSVVSALARLFISGGVVAFLFGVTKFIWGIREGKETDITNGKQFMIWSLIGLFVMFSVYGIIKVAQSLIPGLNATTITIPDIKFGGSGVGPSAPGGNTGSDPLGGSAPGGNTNSGSLGGSAPGANTVMDPQQRAEAAQIGASAPGGNTGTLSPAANGESCNIPEDCLSNYCKTSRTGAVCATAPVTSSPVMDPQQRAEAAQMGTSAPGANTVVDPQQRAEAAQSN
jgi:general stress protein YciG